MWLHVLRGWQEVLLRLPCSLDLMVFWSLLLRSHFMLHDMAGHTFLEDLLGSLSMCYQIFSSHIADCCVGTQEAAWGYILSRVKVTQG